MHLWCINNFDLMLLFFLCSMMMNSRILMKFIVAECEFFHMFTPFSSMLIMSGNPDSPYSPELCRSQLQDEKFRHAVEQKSSLHLFTALNWNPDTWINELADNLLNMEYVWVHQPVAVVHPFDHLESSEPSFADDEEWD